jgi:hypothetical protein
MSGHRSRPKPIELERKECNLWPDCACHQTIIRYQRSLWNEDIIWETHELAAIETILFCALDCVSKFCPELRVRNYARGQLRDRWWDAQKRNEILTEADVRRMAIGGRR